MRTMFRELDYDDDPASKILLCAGCGGADTHQFRVDIYEREREDDESGVHVFVEGDPTMEWDPKVGIDNTASMVDNPSGRRNGLSVHFYCEECRAVTKLSISQHKGATCVDVSVEDVCAAERLQHRMTLLK